MLEKILKFILKRSSWTLKNKIFDFLILENINFSKNRTIALLENRLEYIKENK